MGDSNTVVSDYTMYRHLQQYCSNPTIYSSKCGSANNLVKELNLRYCQCFPDFLLACFTQFKRA